MLSPDTESVGSGQVNWYQFGRKTLYIIIPKKS